MGEFAMVLYVLAMVAVMVGMDFALFQHRFRARLIANVCIVLVFGLVYVVFLRRL